MKNSKTIVSAAVLVLVVIFGLIFYFPKKGGDGPKLVTEPTPIPEGPCPGPEQIFKITDVHMKGAFEPGSDVEATLNYFACNAVKKGDFVVYRFSATLDPVIRVVRAAPGDKFRLIPDKKNKGWNLEVNGDVVTVNGTPYFFGRETPTTMSLYEKSSNGQLGPNDAIVLSLVPPGDRDSSVFGVVSIKDFIAKAKSK